MSRRHAGPSKSSPFPDAKIRAGAKRLFKSEFNCRLWETNQHSVADCTQVAGGTTYAETVSAASWRLTRLRPLFFEA